MGHGKQLSEYEKGQIDILKSQNASSREIARQINRSDFVVNNYLKNKVTYGTNKSTGRPKSLTQHARRRLIRSATNKSLSATRLRDMLDLSACVRTIQRCLCKAEHLVRRKIRRKPVLNKRHIAARLSFAKKYALDPTIWTRIIFSDEKKFNLDGPDGFDYYWHDLRTDDNVKISRQMGGGSVMVWAAVGVKKNSNIAIIEGRQDSEKYITTLSTHLLGYGDVMSGPNYIF